MNESPLEKAAVYRRVSTDHQDNSLVVQEAANDDYCRRLQLALDRTFDDPDVSGSIPFRERNGGRALLNRLAQGGIQHLVVSKQDRLGRDTLDQIATIRYVWSLGILLHIVMEGGAKPRTPENELMFEMKASCSQYERNQIRSRVQTVLNHKFHRGELTGNVPFGYDALYTFADGFEFRSPKALSATALAPLLVHGAVRGKFLVDNPAEQAWVLRIVEMRKTMNLNQLAQWLNANGVKPKLPAGTLIRSHGRDIISSGRWSTGNVDSLLKSRHTEKILSNAEHGTRNAEAA